MRCGKHSARLIVPSRKSSRKPLVSQHSTGSRKFAAVDVVYLTCQNQRLWGWSVIGLFSFAADLAGEGFRHHGYACRWFFFATPVRMDVRVRGGHCRRCRWCGSSFIAPRKSRCWGRTSKSRSRKRQGRHAEAGGRSAVGRQPPRMIPKSADIPRRATARTEAGRQLPFAAVRLRSEVGRHTVGSLGKSVGGGARGGMGRTAERLRTLPGDSAGAGWIGSATGSVGSGAVGSLGNCVSQRSAFRFSIRRSTAARPGTVFD